MTTIPDGRARTPASPPAPAPAPVHPSQTEAGRLLCAGTYLDRTYRDRVIDELYVHEERFTAPSYGFDAARVLAHALRARRAEVAWAAAVVAIWALGLLLTQAFFVFLLVPALLTSAAGRIKRRRDRTGRGSVLLEYILRGYAAWMFARILWGMVLGFWEDSTERLPLSGLGRLFSYLGQTMTAPDSNPLGIFLEWPRLGQYFATSCSWAAVLVLVLVTVVAGLQRGHFARVLQSSLDRDRYASAAGLPQVSGRRYERARERIERIQHGPLVLYDVANPFCGAGTAHLPWQLSVELRPRGDGETQELDNASIVDRIRPRLEALRVPSPHGSPEAQASVLDRLRELVIDECVFLPAAGLPDVDALDLSAEAFAEHRAIAVEEGGERRRHFLRVRIGGWDENLVITVFIRVHTQGGMLMLEVAPHVLLPVRPDFQMADDIAQRFRRNSAFAKAAWAVATGPGSLGPALLTLTSAIRIPWRMATAGHRVAIPAGPAISVRELASQPDASLFQLMDLDRYLKTIQDRIVGGVTLALHEAGWQTGEFAERAVNVAEGAVFIQTVNNSAFGIGGVSHNSASAQQASDADKGKHMGPGKGRSGGN
ncbi:hypothetical protein [Streptomyces sp. ISL-94]|uniref:hypothetical protein n=1 Tax=Streptomyces sp. ISL-94 TaxID=2819190 RepID=UPI001BE5414D|nr:hypothetical protein [Streptomyces sp. ISL-94]MBT2480297.1 hypothetical protein [Streptomyces sp. ISL-94]